MAIVSMPVYSSTFLIVAVDGQGRVFEAMEVASPWRERALRRAVKRCRSFARYAKAEGVDLLYARVYYVAFPGAGVVLTDDPFIYEIRQG
jgi:hypothetical protein